MLGHIELPERMNQHSWNIFRDFHGFYHGYGKTGGVLYDGEMPDGLFRIKPLDSLDAIGMAHDWDYSVPGMRKSEADHRYIRSMSQYASSADNPTWLRAKAALGALGFSIKYPYTRLGEWISDFSDSLVDVNESSLHDEL